ncbi:hypothetical protein FB451DRAFT_1552295 [Mycena latifolia]|nr:hypothetical protein FB451DRAFT_1552295 [Mycena latifolia]
MVAGTSLDTPQPASRTVVTISECTGETECAAELAERVVYSGAARDVKGFQGYWMDLTYPLENLRFPIDLPDLTPEFCSALGKLAVYTSAMKFLDAEISGSTRLYMLHGRKEPLENEPALWSSVIILNWSHRRALARLIVSQHPLAVERMRYNRVTVPRDERLRRFGCASTETVEHALFFCNALGPGLDDLRDQFADAVHHLEPKVPLKCDEDTLCQVAKFAYKVFKIFNAEPMAWPPEVASQGAPPRGVSSSRNISGKSYPVVNATLSFAEPTAMTAKVLGAEVTFTRAPAMGIPPVDEMFMAHAEYSGLIAATPEPSPDLVALDVKFSTMQEFLETEVKPRRFGPWILREWSLTRREPSAELNLNLWMPIIIML